MSTSARYSVLDAEFYLPEPENIAAQSATNRQGRDVSLSEAEATEVLRILREDAARNYSHYGWMLNDGTAGHDVDESRIGLSRELARIGLGLNTYTQWYWKCDLHNLLRFLRLRADAHAQYEIRVFADVILDIVKRWVPLTHAAFMEHQMNSLTLSASAVQAVREMLAGRPASEVAGSLPKREWEEVAAALGIEVGK